MAEINLGKVKGDEVTKQSITNALGFPVKEIVFISQSEYDTLLPHEQEDERLFFIKDQLGKIFYKKQLVWKLWDVTFADPLVGQILFDAGVIADPTQSTKEELALITDEDMMVYNEDWEENVSIFLESTITTFDEFQYFTGLTTLYTTFERCESLVEAPIIPEGVTRMEYTFSRCTSLTEAPVIPNSVINMVSTFYDCTSLTEAPVIPDSVTNMEYAFSGCTSLTEAPVIPNSVIDMVSTFYDCTSLNGKFIIEAVTPPIANATTFEDVNVISIKVPAQSVQAYKTAEGWSDFADKIFPIE